jgi:H+-translocating NAD(P) transhydrogenase subunit alpha
VITHLVHLSPVHLGTVHLGLVHLGTAVDGSATGIVAYLTVFVLAAFVGIEVVSKVPSILHTPLMSGSNAIHGIVLVGALTVMGEAHGAAELVLGFLAVFLATLNIVGGFVVTDRMLEMFKSKPGERRATSKANGAQPSPAQAAQAVETGDAPGPADDGGAA